MTLRTLFTILDTDSNKNVDLAEFTRKINSMHIKLDNDEMQSLFKMLDVNSSGSITYAELVEGFSSINTA